MWYWVVEPSFIGTIINPTGCMNPLIKWFDISNIYIFLNREHLSNYSKHSVCLSTHQADDNDIIHNCDGAYTNQPQHRKHWQLTTIDPDIHEDAVSTEHQTKHTLMPWVPSGKTTHAAMTKKSAVEGTEESSCWGGDAISLYCCHEGVYSIRNNVWVCLKGQIASKRVMQCSNCYFSYRWFYFHVVAHCSATFAV